jgi:hypothetical protein
MATLRKAPRRWGLQLVLCALRPLATCTVALIPLALAGSAYAETKATTPQAPAAASTSAESTSPQAPPAPDDASVAEARMHFENGIALLQASPPNYQDAHQQFLLAYEKSGKRWSILGNLALCALNLERDGEALAHYEAYLAQGGAEIDPNERASIEREMLLIKGNMATLRLTALEAGTKVSVRREGSSAPAQVYPIAVDGTDLGLRAGQLVVVATAGKKSETWSVVLSAGDAESHAFLFAPPKAEAPVEEKPIPVQTRGPSPVRVAGYVTTGVGIAAIIGGLITGGVTSSKESAARAQCIGNICPESAEADFQAASDLAMVTNVLLIGGGVLTATGVTLVVVGGKRKTQETARQLVVTPHASPFFAGLSAHGTF